MEERVQVAMEEMQDLKSVWHELSTVWTEIDDMKEKPWQTVQPRKVSLISKFVCISKLWGTGKFEVHKFCFKLDNNFFLPCFSVSNVSL